MPVKNDNHKFGGVHGICIYIRNELFDDIEMKCDQTVSDCVLWCIVSNRILGFKFIMGIVYIPHEASKYHSKDCFDNIIIDLATFRSQYNDSIPFILIGDFNARTGNLEDTICMDKTELELMGMDSECNDYNTLHDLGILIKRANRDTFINENGKKLIDLCKITELSILNGRFGVNTGDFTCYTGMGNSAIDYLVVSKEIIPFLSDFNIEPFERTLSDTHCALSLELSGKKQMQTKHDHHANKKGNYLTFDLRWDSDKRDDFLNNFNHESINEFDSLLNNLKDVEISLEDIESLTTKLKDLFVHSASETGLVKEIVKSKTMSSHVNTHKPWFDEKCRMARKEYLKFKNKMQKSKTLESKLKIKNKTKSYTQVIKQAKSKYQKDLHENLYRFKKSKPKLF